MSAWPMSSGRRFPRSMIARRQIPVATIPTTMLRRPTPGITTFSRGMTNTRSHSDISAIVLSDDRGLTGELGFIRTVFAAIPVTSARLRIPAVQDRSKHAGAIFREALSGDERVLDRRVSGADHQDDAVGEATEHARVGNRQGGRRVDDDNVELLPQTLK